MKLYEPRRSFRYPWLVGGCSFLLLVIVVFLYQHLFRYSEEHRKEYDQLMAAANPTLADKSKKNPYQATQYRRGVQKDLSFVQGSDRLQMRVVSMEAHLVLDQQVLHTELIEHMRNVQCFMQEELYYILPDGREAVRQPNGKLLIKKSSPKKESSWISVDTAGLKPMQIIRYCHADKASYHYKSDKFLADQVYISRYIVPGHELVFDLQNLKPVMTGKADSVEFVLSGKDLNFNAQRFRAKISSMDRL